MSHVMNGETNGGGGGGGIEADMVDSRELMMLNNKDFFADDIYDFKETFMRHDVASNGATNGGAQKRSSSKLKNGNEGKKTATRKTNGIVYDVYDGGEEEEDEYDEYGNDQATGVIYEDDDDDDEAVRIGVNRHATAYDEEEDDEEDFRVKPSFPEQPAHSDFHNFVDDMDIGMGETFFKRVDSMELVKPKKTKIISNYLVGELLGDGSYGKVKECLDMNTLARRAVKIINLKMVQRKIPHGVENVRKEIRIMGKLEHKNVIKLYGTFEKGSLNNCPKTPLVPRTNHVNENNNNPHPEDDLLRHTAHIVNSIEKPPKLYIFMDYCITSLEKLLKSAPDSRLRNYQACFYFKQLIDGLEYLHSLNVIHNDIKPGNLLLTCDDVLKICDFSISADLGHFAIDDYLTAVSNHNANSQNNMEDLAKMDSSNANSQINIQGGGNGNSNGINPNLLCGSSIHHTAKFPISQCTPMFQCPEMLDEDMDEAAILREATKIDIWSSGVTLYQLTTGDLPFKGATIHQIFECIRNPANTITIPAFIDHNLEQLLNGMLNRDPVKRFNLSEIRESDWFKRKHPMIREEMAPLPVDALENETSTYRMLNYLEKYCRPESSAAQGVNHPSHNIESNNGGDLMDATASNEDAVISQQPSFQHQSTSAAAAAATNQAQSIVQPTQDNKKFAQAAKAKRNHCLIM